MADPRRAPGQRSLAEDLDEGGPATPGAGGPRGEEGPRIWSVSELTAHVKGILEADPEIQDVWVRGEISNLGRPASGHIYFTLKDDDAALSCAFFRGHNRNLDFDLEDGLQVLARGHVSVYEVRGDYQLYVREVVPEGKGELWLRYLQLKRKLEEEGLFAPERKRALPRFPRRVGVVTSGTGAAVRDIVDVATRRFPGIHLILKPVRVQGEGAAEEVARAIELFHEAAPVDVLIVGRGGGSIEDLWAFNEERVARAIDDAVIPVVSAVGHETDFTIADFVADVRAPTPSAAAELVVPEVAVVLDSLDNLEHRAATSLRHRVERLAQRTDEATQGLARAVKRLLESKRRDLAEAARVLDTLSPLRVLERGYAVAEHGETGALVKAPGDAEVGDPLRLRLARGSLLAEVTGKEEDDDDG